MSKALLFLLLITQTGFSQPPAKTDYDLDYVIKIVRRNGMNITNGTKEIISEIIKTREPEDEQTELIKFYKNAYDFKIVDKAILKNLIDSLTQFGSTEKIKVLALESRRQVESRFLNTKLRELKFPDKKGDSISTTSLSKKITIVELWATSCSPCIKEMKNIPRLRESNANIEFYSISLDRTFDKMIRFVEKNKYDWPIVYGGDQKSNPDLWNYLNIVAIPKYYIVNREGIIIHVADQLEEDIIKALK
jgi:thiol-disulfide isomerase/thioredoxin